MTQRGIDTSDMDVRWVSSLSWYFLNLFGLTSVFILLLGDARSADGLQDMQSMGAPPPLQQPSEILKIFKGEADSLQLVDYKWSLDGIEERILSQFSKKS